MSTRGGAQTLDFLLFGKSVRAELDGSHAADILARELALYPQAPPAASPRLTIRYGAVDGSGAQLVNPAVHRELDDGFIADYGSTAVRYVLREESLSRIDFALKPARGGVRRAIGRWRNIQFLSSEESIGQIFHELVAIPSVYFDANLFPLHVAALEAPSGGVTAIGGTGGVGKTSLELELCRRHGYRFVADDIAVVSMDGRVWPNLAFPKIYAYNVRDDPKLERHVLRGRSLADRAQWRWRARRVPARVRRRISPDELYGACSREGGPLTRYIILVREHRTECRADRITAAVAAALSVRIMAAEYGIFHNHLVWHEMNRLALGGPARITLQAVLARWETLAAQTLRAAECVVVRVPIGMEHDRFRKDLARFVLEHDF